MATEKSIPEGEFLKTPEISAQEREWDLVRKALPVKSPGDECYDKMIAALPEPLRTDARAEEKRRGGKLPPGCVIPRQSDYVTLEEEYPRLHSLAEEPTPNTNPKAAHGALKAPFGFTSTLADIEYNAVMAGGAYKYGAFNFRETDIDAITYIAAIKRHLALWEDGEDYDDESGLPHLAHIMACCSLARDAQHTDSFVDNRSKTGLVKALLAKCAAAFNKSSDAYDAKEQKLNEEWEATLDTNFPTLKGTKVC